MVVAYSGINNAAKPRFKTMVCLSWLFSGTCPYQNQCSFLHDPRLVDSLAAHTLPRLMSTKGFYDDKQPVRKDSFFWPDMMTNPPKQIYAIDVSFKSYSKKRRNNSYHDRSLYSIWNHFIDFLADEAGDRGYYLEEFEGRRIRSIQLDPEPEPEPEPEQEQEQEQKNQYIPGTPRLPIFISLASSLSPPSHSPQKRSVPCEYDGGEIEASDIDAVAAAAAAPGVRDLDLESCLRSSHVRDCYDDDDEDECQGNQGIIDCGKGKAVWNRFRALNESTIEALGIGPEWFDGETFKVPCPA